MPDTQNSILLDTISGKTTKRPPFWFMRQAGRVLPSYLALREKYSFWQMMKDPGMAADITLMPVHDLEVDAAILFSDILVIPYAMGMGLEFTDKGPVFNVPLVTLDNPIAALRVDTSRLEYIYHTIDNILIKKPGHIPLIGFCGAPLTVLLYMLQGLSRNSDFPDAIKFIYQHKETTKKLVDAIVEVSIEYAVQQVKHGIHVFQLFETHGGILPWDLYKELFLPGVERIARAVKSNNIPFIYFPKGIGMGIKDITPDMCDFLGIDWQISLSQARKNVHADIGLQGNIDPRILYAPQKEIGEHLSQMVEFGSKNPRWVLNLGHGFLPDTPYENALFLSKQIQKINWHRYSMDDNG